MGAACASTPAQLGQQHNKTMICCLCREDGKPDITDATSRKPTDTKLTPQQLEEVRTRSAQLGLCCWGSACASFALRASDALNAVP